jgi:CHAT domain-containing protein
VLVELGTVDRAVFIPGGLLGLLPLHAAWTLDPNGVDGRRYALDSLTITYVPNARALAAARELAGHPANRLVTVTDPPHAPGIRTLRWAPVETSLAEHLMSGPCVHVEQSGATARRVLAEIAAADVAHLACHGIADLINPLDSGLLLAHGDVLRLRDLLALRSQLRLAVLSACETSMPGTELPDEVVALPTGLLQAGVGGVVASLWAVPDLATTLLMAEFYRRWRRVGEQPPDALRSAQLWLRDTTRTQKVRHLVAGVQEGWLHRQECADLLRELFGRNEDERLFTAWAGFAYVGA